MKNKETKFTLGIIFLSVLVIIWVLPIVVESVLEKNAKEWVGRNISIEDIDINLFTGTVKLFDFDLYEENGEESFVSFDTLILNSRPYHYFNSKITVQQLHVKNLKTNVIKENDSVFNFDTLIAFHESPKDSSNTVEGALKTSDILKFSLSNIDFKNSEIIFHDKLIDEIFIFNELDFLVPNIEWNQEDKSDADLAFKFKKGGSFFSSTSFDPVKGDFIAKIGLSDMDLSGYTKYLKEFLLLHSAEGLVSTMLNFKGNINKLEDLSINGYVNMDSFMLTDSLRYPIIKADKINCNLKEIAPLKNIFIIDSIQLNSPYIAFSLFEDSNNLETFFRLNDQIDPIKSSETSAELVAIDSLQPLYLKLNSFLINSGELKFIDATTSQPFEYSLTNIEMNLDSLDSNSKWVDTQAKMLLNKRGVMKVDVGFNPLDPMEIELKYVISGFKLNDLNVYSMDYMGVPVLKGDMYYKTYTKIHNGQLDSENKLIIHNATLGDKRGGLYNLPLKFALFLLKDKDGVVNLEVPVGGDLNDPNVRVNKIVWNTFKNLLVKTAASPVKFLAGVVGADPKDLETFEFSYLDTTLNEMHLKQVEKLEDLERKKKGLLIQMLYLNDIELEKNHIAVQQIGNEFNKKFKKNYSIDQEEFKLYLLGKTQTDTAQVSIKKMLDSSFVQNACVSLANPKLIDSLALVYEHKRIEGLKDVLLLNETKNKIKVRRSNYVDIENIGSKPLFKITYSIEE